MRHFEYAGGGSEKFWEIDRDGTSVTVRFGRIGTTGQTQVKDLGSEGAAGDHVARLVAEKLKKGYAENSTTVLPSPPAQRRAPLVAKRSKPAQAGDAGVEPAEARPVEAGPAGAFPSEPDLDEDGWEVPAAWWRQAEPFRGRGPARSTAVDAAAHGVVAELRTLAEPQLTNTLGRPESDAELVQRARLFLGTPAGLLRRARHEVQPLGAAVVGAVLAATGVWQHRNKLPAVVDDWAAAHGIVFAAEAGVLMAGVRVFNPARPHVYGSKIDMIIGRAQPNDIGLYPVEDLLTRLRALLAAADEADYAEVVERLTEHRSGQLSLRLATSYLVPTEQQWLNDDLALIRSSRVSGQTLALLLASATTEGQATAILNATTPWSVASRPRLIYSMAAHIGPDVAPVLVRLLDNNLGADGKKRIIAILGQLPTDAAFDLLLGRLDQKYFPPVMLEAMARFPRRAMRLLAAAATGTDGRATTARDLVRGHAISHPRLVERTRPELNASAAQVLDKMVAATATLPEAPPERLPALLVTPPWTARQARLKPVVLQGLGPQSPTRISWKEGEQLQWASADTGYNYLLSATNDWAGLVDRAVGGQDWRQVPILALAPVDLVRPRLAQLTPTEVWDAGPSLRRILGQMGDDAVDFVQRVAFLRPASLAEVLLPLEGSAIAARMAEWYVRSKSTRAVAQRWLDRHSSTAARDLVPLALGKPGKDRVAAETGLRYLDQRGHHDAILAAAGTHGPDAVEAIGTTLALDPTQVLPARMPSLPTWLDPAHLPQVLLADRSVALPATAAGHICTMLAISKPGETYAGIDVVRRAVDPASLAEMAWGLFERWRGAGFPSRDGWVLEALGHVGDDETVRRLAPLIRAWPGESAHARAVAGLDVLSAIGSDVALMHLHGIAEKAKFKGLRTKANAKMDEVADGLGLSGEQLADRLVPDFGLDADGSLLLDYGGRKFRVGFDEQLKPTVADEDGARRKVLPKPSAKDDPVLGASAYALFRGLKKDVKTVAADQIRRFERAMVAGRRWTAAEQRTLFIEHPLLWHLARRLVWATFDQQGEAVGSFRVAEDHTLADSADEERTVADQTVVGVAHPLHLGDSIGIWSDLFADYEILQPFPQLGREVLQLTDAERNAKVLERFTGVKVYTGKVLGLSHRGWERGMAQDAGIQGVTYKPVAGGRAVVIDLDPGIVAGDAMEWPEQTIAGVWLNQGPAEWGNSKGNLSFALLDAITASEVLRDIEALCP